ncbi:glycoside hydrolase family 75 protein [Sphingomonas bacterium]|uniref:glycoside hydrolase family 75 protein n=1 Tax=Sphingomonas bacterium TaxID=1895847 RepID=UPI0015761822|nr:glycoside hydrolase family 75 protein [Sphingomonas bacterium]
MPIPLALILAAASVAPAAPVWPAGVTLPAGRAIDEDYRRQFDRCDRERRFRGRRPKYGCKGDPNAVTALRRLPGGAVAFVSKLAVDLDGSAYACSPNRGRTDQCPTSLMLPDGRGGEVPVDAGTIPYVVIPQAGPKAVRGEFERLTGVGIGDFGVVIANGRTVPVIVADTGPYAKLGEGSLALHQALGRRLCTARGGGGQCTAVVSPMESMTGGVTTILFPGSARGDLTSANIAGIVRVEGMQLLAAARKGRD